jgi:hypothetical protein
MENTSLLSERPANFQWWAVRLGSLIGAAIILIVLGMAVGGAIESRTLAQTTFLSPQGYKIDFRIHREREDIFVSVKQVRNSGTGWSQMLNLGTKKSLGGTDASIQLDERGERVVIRAGEKLVVFDLNSNHFDFPEGHSR